MEGGSQPTVPSTPTSDVVAVEVPSSTNIILNTASLLNWAYYVLAILAFLKVRHAKRRAARSTRRGIRYLEAAVRKKQLEERKKWEEHKGRKATKTSGMKGGASARLSSTLAVFRENEDSHERREN
ncbi:putative transmembrane protein [Toxoplasma gondii TgCatPRC2]|uniref:Transmembrane protein n=14 Tax=Toxoplasma gondii TaxID=5811 RepID=A0A125YJ99_TOXGG|nr:hypothetical protein TGME49_297980 [Toxoplasma gondii ME49]EPR58332.1 hypothetical protein TGGT1_297980 [Toxoplasma gondii GT1]ESS29891.1 putative transmembrane protein [Toxoplasma gondii VEG]KAF4645789.1 hypothetical protein TGRH88_002750 [Toxoplasma gondii]KFG30136.1 putative transmembrane protein [Toxoplasma gondii p89]KFG40082.1 putative transmembrane protein [Toxoplasma gondii FOU]KFG42023.1 putative transmembrane protein [Toxoplasma gondii GAB2-2007-GAL-DOM2]KFH01052.1 putative tran|eukprot:XP_018638385.1 hypothetical protein TGME49_297980 [Toxoplasma gondii ME49]